MAGPYYVDPAAAGSNNGSDWTNAWTSLQSALDTAQAGEIVYCRGTQTLTATLDVDTNSGTNASGFIKIIGCNSSGNVDGTRFTIDANDGSYHGITFAASMGLLYWWENIRITNTGTGNYDGVSINVTGSSSGYNTWINCSFDSCGRYGYTPSYAATNSLFIRCVFFNNTNCGIYGGQYNIYIACAIYGNGADGVGYRCGHFIGCVIHDNTDRGFEVEPYAHLIMNTVIDGNDNGGYRASSGTTAARHFLFGTRITNHSAAGKIGLDANSEVVVTSHCYFEDNDGDNIQNASLHYNIPLEGGSSNSNLEDLANTNEGYVDPANHDFSTGYTDSGDPDLRRTAITIPWS